MGSNFYLCEGASILSVAQALEMLQDGIILPKLFG